MTDGAEDARNADADGEEPESVLVDEYDEPMIFEDPDLVEVLEAEAVQLDDGDDDADGETADGVRPVSLRARKLARELKVDARRLAGSGPGGRITSRDVRAAVEGLGGGAPEEEDAWDAAGGEAGTDRVAYTGVRKRIGERMRAALTETAQVTINASANATALVEARRFYKNEGAKPRLRIGVTELVCWAVARVLSGFPEVNARFDAETGEIVRSGAIDLGVAVETPRGLMVPVIPDADRLSLDEFSAELARLVVACRYGGVDPEALHEGTFTVANLGGLGVESFTPILNPPQAAVLGVCAIRPAAIQDDDGGIVFQPRIGFSLTFDHRILAGSDAARFLQAVVAAVEYI